MNSNLARLLFLSVEYFRKEPIINLLAEANRNNNLSKLNIDELQKKRLIYLLNHAYYNSAYYRKLFNENSIEVSKFKSIEEIKQIPILNKSTFQKNLSQIFVKNCDERYSLAKTSGSTGIPLKFLKDRDATAVHNACYYRGLGWHGIDIGFKEAMLWGLPVNTLARYKIRLIDLFLNRFKEKEYNLNSDTLFDFYDKMKKKKPVFLSGYSSMIYQFADFIKENNLDGRDLGLKIVKCTSETIRDDAYGLVEEVFGCPLVCEYGSAETGIIAFSCEKGKIHLMSDFVLVEFEDPKIELGEKDLKEIIVTPLLNYSTPLIRYTIGDYGIQSQEKCECGRNLPIIKKIIGRSSNIVYAPNGKKYHSIIFYYIFKGLQDRYNCINQYKVYQTDIDNLLIFLIKNDKFTKNALEYLNNKIYYYFGNSINIKYEFVEKIERERSGKLMDFVSIADSAKKVMAS